MSKVALITDTHFGARNDSQVFIDYMKSFYTNIFFPYLETNNIRYVIHCGDVFDRRKYINYKSLSECKSYFFDQLAERNLSTFMLAGNHDTFYKSTNQINSVKLLLKEYHNLLIYDEPCEVTLPFDQHVVMIPWICNDNYQRTLDLIKKTKCDLVFGHLEIDGFEAQIGMVHSGGLNKNIFNKFDMVFSGHFHHKSDNKTVYYLGNPYELTWHDYKDQRGFHIFDFETRELEFIPNPYRMFHKFYYNDKDLQPHDLDNYNFDEYKNRYVKVIVQEKLNPYIFDLMMDKMYKAGAFDISIVENFIDIDNNEEIIDEAQDTITILSQYIEQMNTNIDKKILDDLVKTLYTEALNIE